MSAAINLTLAEKREISLALTQRDAAIQDVLTHIAKDKNPRAYDAMKASYLASLETIKGLYAKVRP